MSLRGYPQRGALITMPARLVLARRGDGHDIVQFPGAGQDGDQEFCLRRQLSRRAAPRATSPHSASSCQQLMGAPAWAWKFQAAGNKAVKKKSKIVGQIIELLTVHTYIENEVMYPEVCALLPELKDDVLESYEEHHVADVLCMELAGQLPPLVAEAQSRPGISAARAAAGPLFNNNTHMHAILSRSLTPSTMKGCA
jgi:hypothetical protein